MPSFCIAEGVGRLGGELEAKWWLEGGFWMKICSPKSGKRYFWPGDTTTASDACIVIALDVCVVFSASWCNSNGGYGRSLGEASDLYSTIEN